MQQVFAVEQQFSTLADATPSNIDERLNHLLEEDPWMLDFIRTNSTEAMFRENASQRFHLPDNIIDQVVAIIYPPPPPPSLIGAGRKSRRLRKKRNLRKAKSLKRKQKKPKKKAKSLKRKQKA